MATSERSNYLATGTTLDSVADGSTRKLSNYSTTAHTHDQYATTAHTHTAEDVGAMATSERSNYSTTAHTHTASEVGAMATSERSNYLATGTTLDNIADGSTRKLANYSTTAHTHTAEDVGAMATSERSNYLATGTTLDNIADGSTRKLSDYSTTGHSHAEYVTTATTIPTIVKYGETLSVNPVQELTLLDAGRGVLATYYGNLFGIGHTYCTVEGYSGTTWMYYYTYNNGTWSSGQTAVINETDVATAITNTSNLVVPKVKAVYDALQNYSTTAHTHSQYATTAHTHSEYATTAHTHSEYLTTATTIYEKIYTVDTDYDHMFPSASNTTGDSPYNISREMFDEMVADVEGGKKPVIRFQRVDNGSEQYIEYTFQNMVLMEGSYQLEFVSPGVMGYPNAVAGLTLNANDFDDDPPYQSFFQHFVVPTESSIQSSGFTKNAITGIKVNGSNASVSSGVASISVPTTASDVGAMATSERSNYLATGTTLDNIADGSTRKLSNYSTTAHTHSQYATTAHTHSEYLSTGTTLSSLTNDAGFLTSADTEDFITSAETGMKYYDVTITGNPTGEKVHNALPQGFYASALSDVQNGIRPILRVNLSGGSSDGSVIVLPFQMHSSYQDNLLFTTLYNQEIMSYTAFEDGSYDWYYKNIPTSASSIGALPTGTTLDGIADGTTRKLSDYSTTAHTHSEYSTTAHTHTASEVGAMATSERSNYLATGTTLDNIADGSTRKLANYSTTGHTHTASEVGAMATSERSNYLATGTTLDNIADGSTRKLSNYSTTAHTHSEYSTTAHTHTASEVGAMATSERSNYLTTATTIPTESSIQSSGFTKNAITGVTFNGTAATVSNGVASITAPTLPSVTSSDNGNVLMVVNGAWAAVTPTTIYTGTGTPDSQTGNDGDIYLQTE